VLAGFHEDAQARPRFLIDRYLPTFLASLAHSPDTAAVTRSRRGPGMRRGDPSYFFGAKPATAGATSTASSAIAAET